MVSYLIKPSLAGYKWEVLILIVVDNGIVLTNGDRFATAIEGLNPYCSGQWYRTFDRVSTAGYRTKVLILIVVDNGIVLFSAPWKYSFCHCLNPYCSGQWYRTCLVSHHKPYYYTS